MHHNSVGRQPNPRISKRLRDLMVDYFLMRCAHHEAHGLSLAEATFLADIDVHARFSFHIRDLFVSPES